jgi:hypothetical protein
MFLVKVQHSKRCAFLFKSVLMNSVQNFSHACPLKDCSCFSCTYYEVYSCLCARKFGIRVYFTVSAHCYRIIYITKILSRYEGKLIIKYN